MLHVLLFKTAYFERSRACKAVARALPYLEKWRLKFVPGEFDWFHPTSRDKPGPLNYSSPRQRRFLCGNPLLDLFKLYCFPLRHLFQPFLPQDSWSSFWRRIRKCGINNIPSFCISPQEMQKFRQRESSCARVWNVEFNEDMSFLGETMATSWSW